jgi:beta-lactam-binding protein with PASTA domain
MRRRSAKIAFSGVLAAILASGCGHAHYQSRFAGPQHFAMPDLRGVDAAKAEKRLRAAGKIGLVDWREEDCGREHAVGKVCCTYPWPGAAVMMREPIVVYVQAPLPTPGAPAPTRAPVPDVVGKRLEEARATLAAAGFARVSVQYLEHDGCDEDIVCGMGPRPGATGHRALVKVLYVGKKVAAATEPPAPPPLKAPQREKPPASFF